MHTVPSTRFLINQSVNKFNHSQPINQSSGQDEQKDLSLFLYLAGIHQVNRLQGLEGLKEEVDLAAPLGEEPLAHHLELHLDPALWNRNRRNRNFLTSGTGTGTVP
jgi:hypothetical protein